MKKGKLKWCPVWKSEQQYISYLESFMSAVARELKCLPSFADPSPEGGNAHIMRKLRVLVAYVQTANNRKEQQ
jgi:hypothetical protein